MNEQTDERQISVIRLSCLYVDEIARQILDYNFKQRNESRRLIERLFAKIIQ